MSKDHFTEFWDNVENKSLEHKINNWFEQNKKMIRRLAVTLISIIPLAVLWMQFIFKPVNQSLLDYDDQGGHDPVIVLGMVAFLFMSLFFLLPKIGIWIDKLIWNFISYIRKESI